MVARTLRKVSWVALLGVLGTSGCEGCDAGALLDGGGVGSLDAGAQVLDDAGPEDAGPEDAGPEDAGRADAGGSDAGPGDAGGGDAGGGSQDAGLKDAGGDDAGAPDEDAGSPVACLSSRECAAPAVCSDLQDEGAEVIPYCRAPESGGGALGALCEGSEGCESGLCQPRAEVCSVVCEDAALDCQAGAVCTAYPFGATDGASWIAVCAPGCGGDDDCPGGRVCTYNGNLPADVFDAVCELPAGPGGLGAACGSPGDCASGLCLPGEGCTRACQDGSDCAGGLAGNPMGACEDVEVFSPAGEGGALLRMCR